MNHKSDEKNKTDTADATDSSSKDVVLLHGRTDDGQGIKALRARRERLELTEIRPMQEGKPLSGGEVVRLRPRSSNPLICDVDVQFDNSEGSPGHAGPPCVASDRYRRNWDAVFGQRGRTELN